jgi:two-component SAPR family response regulator
MEHNKVSYIKNLLSLILILFFSHKLLYSQDYGLSFKGQKYMLDERTGLDLTPGDFLRIDENFDLTFSVKIDFDQPEPLFGYILRIISRDTKSIDLLVSNKMGGRGLNLVGGDKQTEVPLGDVEFNKEKWVELRIKFLLEDNQLRLYLPDSSFVKKDIFLEKNAKFKIFFGANDYKQFATSDVPDMSIKDIKITQNDDVLYHYPLNESNGTIAFDKISNNKATAKKPNWIIQDYQIWKKRVKTEVTGVQIVTANEEKGIIYLLREKELSVYSVKDGSFKTTPYKNGKVKLSLHHRALYNNVDNKIYCYLPDKNLCSVLDIENANWDTTQTFVESSKRQSYKHHNSVFSAFDNSIYTFGGYGHYAYNNEVRKIDLKNKSWENLPTNDTIFSPRYLAGLGKVNDTIYILGGYGSETGNQLVSPKNYFDLFGYSIKSKKFIKKFDIPRLSDDMILANNMWIDPLKRNYYALISDKNKSDGELQLIKGCLDKPLVEKVGDIIPYKFFDVQTYSNLYYMPTEDKLYAYTSFIKDSISVNTQFSIHSISYPAIPFSEVNPIIKKKNSLSTWGYILILLVFSFIGGYLFKRKIRTKNTVESDVSNISETKGIPQVAAKEIDFNPLSKNLEYQIIFFGGFQVIDKNQQDITNKFSPLLKELFLLIWLSTFKNNKGISSDKLVEVLWYDKSPRSAQNNRSVNITKLRSLLNAIGGCGLTKETGYWKIDHDFKELKSDYYELLQITDSKNVSKEYIEHLIKITKKGAFLHNLSYEWLDDFKADISERIINALMTHVETVDIQKHPNFTVRLSDCIFNFDSINEEAMILKCKAQYSMGTHSLAENTFNKFKKEYNILYGQEYDSSFTDILNKD